MAEVRLVAYANESLNHINAHAVLIGHEDLIPVVGIEVLSNKIFHISYCFGITYKSIIRFK